MEDEDPVAGSVGCYMEADQDPEVHLEDARESLTRLLSAIETHASAMDQLRIDHAAGKFSLPDLERELREREALVRKLRLSLSIFELRVRELENLTKD